MNQAKKNPHELHYVYRDDSFVIRICPGPLLESGEPVAGITHGNELLIAGDEKPERRLGIVLDQWRRMLENWYGPMNSTSAVTFAYDAYRALIALGGEEALKALKPTSSADRRSA